MAFTMFGRTIRKVGVIGSGNIGPDIALHFSQNLYAQGVPVVVVDIVQAALDAGSKKAESKMVKAAEKGIYKKEVADAIFKNMLFTTAYGKIADADFVIEAAFERMDVKHKIFDQCQAACPKTAIFASNSSHMEPEEIFKNMKEKSRCLVIHYFFPAERNILLEVVPGKDTDPGLTEYLMKLYEFIGKAPIKVKSRYGYAVDPIFEGLFEAAALTVEKGLATVKQADAIVQKALRMGVGPFTAHNLAGGNPITQHGLNEMNAKNIMPWYRSPKILDDQVKSGKPWETAARGEVVEYSPETYEAVSSRVLGAYFGMICEIVDSGISNIGDMELAMDVGLVLIPPFSMMNKMGVKKALELVEAYAKENPGFKVAEILKKQAASGKPWKIPVVFREDKGDVAIVKIRRPKVLNALNEDVFEQLREHFHDIQKDPKIKGAVLTGFGTRAFVSGADIGMLAAQKTAEEAEKACLKNYSILSLMENLGKPVVCAMNGLAFGGGNEIAMSCTARIAKKGQKIFVGQPEPKLGFIPGAGGTQRLPRLIGIEKAWPILRNSNPISSSEAKAIGLIQEEVEGDLIEAGMNWVKNILSGKVKVPSIPKGPIPIPSKLPEVDIGHLSRKIDSLLQKAILEGAKKTLDDGLKLEAKIFGECFFTQDRKIGIDNFMKNGPKVNANFVHN
ncbi:MAG TPA: 3-hydroxyacyl-CoA dehydrogenase/enoyl-CoA hydratase family protein [Thermodesulfobacteriota bacterium]|nr:3-hydroxyacyl-CoA dehydrogenase/enoyl-CoA hydratase family protein [Thermodesulfobacteriota bacterium]